MYESYYHLTARPFLAAPLPDRYYPASSIEQARETISRCVDRGAGPAVAMGPAGTGKSMLCHVIAEQFRDRFSIVSLASARLCTRRALLQNILYELGLPYREREEGELRLALVDHLRSPDIADGGLLLLVDEAHTLPLRLLEEVRMLTNLVHDGRLRVHLVLAAGSAFDERLASPRLESLNQRIAARCYLQSMTRDETVGYVLAQLAAVGARDRIILTPDAIDAVYRATDGVPRLVNQVCNHALVLGAIGRHETIDAGGIEQAWADLQQLPLPAQDPSSNSSDSGGDILEFGELDDEPNVELGLGTGESLPEPADEAPVVVIHRPEESEDRLDTMTEQADDGDTASHPAGSSGQAAEIELVFEGTRDPFDEPFEDEEVLVDPYASLEALNTPHVTLSQPHKGSESAARSDVSDMPLPAKGTPRESEAISFQWEPPRHAAGEAAATSESEASEPHASEIQLPPDDRDLLVVFDDARSSDADPQSTGSSNVRPYRYLFAELRGRIA